jgi:hypothetical protein
MMSRTLCTLSLVLTLLMTALSEAQPPGRRGRRRSMPLSMRLISLPEIQHELHVTSSQIQLLEALQADIMSQRGVRDSKTRNQRNAVVAKLWNVLLEEDQAQRFSEVTLQFEGLYAIDRDGRADFVKDLELTETQLRAIRELREDGNPVEIVLAVDDLLEDAQLKKWERKLGKSFAFTDDTLAYRTTYLPYSLRRRERGFGWRRGGSGQRSPGQAPGGERSDNSE